MAADPLRVLATGLRFPESLRLREGAVWFSDATRVCSVVPGEPPRVRGNIPARLVLGLSFLPDGRAISNAVQERVVYAIDNGKAEPLVDVSTHTDSWINEVVATPDGGLVVGPTGFDMLAGEAPRTTRLLRVHADGRIEPSGPDLLFPNGMCLADDGKRLVIAESLRGRVVSIDILADGSLSPDAVVVADATGWEGHPDGISYLADGSVWYGDPLSGEAVHASGTELIRRVRTGYAHIPACVVDETAGILYLAATDAMPAPGLEWDGKGALLAVDLTA
ncbi:SMP-30/gluconolactonase/LRE family protein [Frankia sp. CcI49]|uniref:SMP-30/gluconolactonase/LRE family protein n=1 Tax=Frankia sp. CcI49 TaxID=1745382 RepID=UPI0013042439|nr:SMP-30/gluconolactonase/LRE family protein [Frankia sp. CcI49]